ncbi:FAD-dependent monooxygenase [Tenacibaculum xiamenense]|uniref:FAD-dependent monooxygenase n=1 Tax=Tenacibaculum xiamenense TaxID=1261553 RepID=UPI0038955C35
MHQPKNKIGIVGGGIGGLTTALTLKNQNIPFQLYEKSNAFKEVGAGIGISSNALKIFDKLHIGDELRSKGHLLKKTILATQSLQTLKTIPFPEEVYCIHRATLIDTITNKLNPDSYKLGKHVKSVKNSDQVKVEFTDKSTENFTTLIVSDGINSTIRKSIFPKINIRHTDQIIWRGITDFEIDSYLQHNYFELFGDSLRFLFLPINNHQLFWLAIQDKTNFSKPSEITIKKHLLETYKSFSPLVLKMLQKTKNESILQNELSDIQPSYKKWYQKNIVFIGDSIHATTPNLAQGACQAIEDAYTLGICLKNKPNNEEAFSLYQNVRLNKVKYIVKNSWQLGKMALTKNNLQKKLLYLTLRMLPKSIYQKRFNKINNIDYLGKIEMNMK